MAPLEAVLFDIDGTMAISDPFHHRATSEMLLKVGYNNGVPITPEFGMAHMAGRSNEQIGRFLFPDWDQARLDAFFAEKLAMVSVWDPDTISGARVEVELEAPASMYGAELSETDDVVGTSMATPPPPPALRLRAVSLHGNADGFDTTVASTVSVHRTVRLSV